MTDNARLILFSGTLFLSAALMFGLQPMVGKMLLPIVGGTPSGWIVAMAFFQVMLLAGYFLAHALASLQPRTHGIAYLACLGLGLVFMPIMLKSHAGLVSAAPDASDIFLLLCATTAIPFIALSASASTIQRLFTTTSHASAQDPYFLYAASNMGSFAGLLLYPFIVEPFSTLTAQSWGLVAGYLLLIAMGAWCLFSSPIKPTAEARASSAKISYPGWPQCLEWMFLAMIPSALLLAVTAHITTDVIQVPMLWILPLALYLLTYVLAFGRNKRIIPQSWLYVVQPALAGIVILLTTLLTLPWTLNWYIMGFHLTVFFVIALMCHRQLADTRPVHDNGQMTVFYLMISLGGAIGGVLVAFVAPLIFSKVFEYPILLALSALCNRDIRDGVSRMHIYVLLTLFVLITVIGTIMGAWHIPGGAYLMFLAAVLALMGLHPQSLLITSIALISYVLLFANNSNPTALAARNFYGVVSVYDLMQPMGTNGEEIPVRYMLHGTTRHGTQMLGEGYETIPTTYYTREGPLGQAINVFNPRTMGAVGLGAGSANCFAENGREITFFEINPIVVDMAQKKFTYLSKCGNGEPRIILGDARLELKKLENEKFDMIILDAFSSDMVPAHLLTQEAIAGYLDRLAPNGTLLFHISNRYFRLDVPIIAAGAALGMDAVMTVHQHTEPYAVPISVWIMLTPKDADISDLRAHGWKRIKLENAKAWTDDYTNILSSLNWFNH